MSEGPPLFSRCELLAKMWRWSESQHPIDSDDDDDDACSRMTIMTCDKGGMTTINGGGTKPWSDLTHDVMFLVMMQLGVIDFVAFSGVCKSWRSFALCNMNTFMVSRPPMFMYTHDGKNDEDDDEWCCHLKDVEGRRFKTVVGHSVAKICLGITCGYVILFGLRTDDFWLVNLITRHELHFPNAPENVILHASRRNIRAILVFSPSISGSSWVFLVINMNTHEIWFSRESGAWDHVSSTVPIVDLNFWNGKIYTLHGSTKITSDIDTMIGVMRLDPKPSKITILETKNCPSSTRLGLVCSGENLYLLQEPSFFYTGVCFTPLKLNFDEMKWVVADEYGYAFFLSCVSPSVAVKPESWWQSQFRISRFDDLCGDEYFFESGSRWYFPHECLNINHIDE